MKTMKNILLIMLAGVAMMMSSCSKDSPVDPVAPVNPPAPADRWEDILTCQVEEIFQGDEFDNQAIIPLDLIVSGAEAYQVPQWPTVCIKSQGSQLYISSSDGTPCTERELNWVYGDGKRINKADRYIYVPMLPKIGVFDFTLEVPAPDPRVGKSYRTKLLRLKIDQNESGVWSAEFLPIQN